MVQSGYEGWQWQDVNPLTAGFVAVFSNVVVAPEVASLIVPTVANIVEPDTPSAVSVFNDWATTRGLGDLETAMITFAASRVRFMDPSLKLQPSIERIGSIAGGGPAREQLARQAGAGVERRGYSAIPMLQLLSELAVKNLRPVTVH